MNEQKIKEAVEKFETLIRAQEERAERIKQEKDFVDYDALDTIVIGVCGTILSALLDLLERALVKGDV